MYEFDDVYEKECFDCHNKDEQLKDIKYWLQAIVDHLYTNDNFDTYNFENDLEELCHIAKIPFPSGQINIQQKSGGHERNDLELDLRKWISWNNHYIKNKIHH